MSVHQIIQLKHKEKPSYCVTFKKHVYRYWETVQKKYWVVLNENDINCLLLQLSVSNATQVYLRDVGFNLSGNLSCEVTTDGPSFKTALVSKRIIVVGK